MLAKHAESKEGSLRAVPITKATLQIWDRLFVVCVQPHYPNMYACVCQLLESECLYFVGKIFHRMHGHTCTSAFCIYAFTCHRFGKKVFTLCNHTHSKSTSTPPANNNTFYFIKLGIKMNGNCIRTWSRTLAGGLPVASAMDISSHSFPTSGPVAKP